MRRAGTQKAGTQKLAILTGVVLAAALGWQGGAAHAAVELTFGVGLRLASDSNPALVPASPTSSHRTTAALNLSFGLTSQTANSTLSIQATTGLEAARGAGSADVNGLNNPGVTLAYAHEAGLAEVTLDAGLASVNLGQAVAATEFQTGTGKRRTASLTAGLTWGKDAPFGAGLSAGVTDVSYLNTITPGLLGSRTLQLGATAHTDLSPVLHLAFGLSDSRFLQDGRPTRDTPGVQASLTLDRKTGTLSASLTSDHAPQGQRSTLSLQDQMTLPAGALSFSLGATRSASAKTYATGALAYQQDLPEGAVTLGLNRSVQDNAYTNAETILSGASAGYSHAVNPRASLALALNWAEQRDTATDLAVTNTNLSATWTQDLTADWALDLGYTRYMRHQDLVGKGQSDSLFITLHRAFSVRY